ncbi:hypothetical protein F5884DRAFT_812555 [Xylogone sp. PMI_703]|nr:hypothetical protein F5884DRAFT_812555 [Xylogone sp. PMI_703]
MASARQNKAADETSRQSVAQNRRARPSTVTEARRQQNRIASKVYREKRKRKLEFLEQLASSQQQAAIPVSRPNVLKTPTGVEPNSPAQAEIRWAQGSQPIPTQGFDPVEWNCYVDTTLLGNHVTINDVTNWQYENQLHNTSSIGSNVYAPHFGTSDIPLQSNGIDGLLHPTELPLPTSSQGNIDIGDNLTRMPFNVHSEGFSEDSHTWSSTTLIQLTPPSVRTSPYLRSSLDGSKQSLVSSLPTVRNSPVASAHKLVLFFYRLGADQRRYLLAITHRKRLRFIDVLTFLANSVENLFFKEPIDYEYLLNCMMPTLPSLQLNNFHITQASFWAAISANAQVLGFELEDYLDAEAISPVSILSTSLDDGKGAGNATEKFSTTPRDLRPSRVQLEKEHHAYLDVLPFPTFRERTLVAVGYDPPLIDEEELCMNLMNDGLVCWGSQDSNGGIDAGMPWDSRSWEPQVWFLKKYWFLVGAQDDEMWSCTKWWHGMRGEKIL